MEFVDPEDEPSPFREPPAPDDRLWRHPSELAGAASSPRRRRHREPPTWTVVGISALITGIVSAGVVVALVERGQPSTSSALAVERQMERRRTVSTVSTSPVVDMAERLRPAIVQLKVQLPGRTGTGSGVVFRTDGHVLTNAHLVEGATAITAMTAAGHEIDGRLVGTDRETDTGVVKLAGGPFAVATLGTAVDLRVGQTVYAMGFPRAVAGGPSMTSGIVSALHQEIHPLVEMIQTDAPIQSGSSGGALLDDDGAVIGITTSAPAGGGAFAYATAIDVAHSVAEELILTGKVVHSWLGIEGGDVDANTAAELDLAGGAVVARVKPGSPAERGGLVARDVIVVLEGRTVHSMGELVVALRSFNPGDTVDVEVLRGGQRRSLKVTLVERPAAS